MELPARYTATIPRYMDHGDRLDKVSLLPISTYMYLRETRQKRADGSLVTHLQLAESVWNPHKKRSEVRIVHHCGRADDPQRAERLRQLARRIRKRYAPAEIVEQAPQWRLIDAWPLGTMRPEAIWHRLGIDAVIAQQLASPTVDFAVERARFAMVGSISQRRGGREIPPWQGGVTASRLVGTRLWTSQSSQAMPDGRTLVQAARRHAVPASTMLRRGISLADTAGELAQALSRRWGSIRPSAMVEQCGLRERFFVGIHTLSASCRW